MSSCFVVGVDGLSEEEEGTILDALRDRGCGWWHWIENLWLIEHPSDEVPATEIRSLFRERIEAQKTIVVLQISCTDWATYGSESEERSYSKWLKEHWLA